MAQSLLTRYGIKEVADVTFYSIDKDSGKPIKPVLYLDTLKVSTIEQTAESTDARGGKGNAALVSWDYGKEITVTLEDALFSAKSLAMMYGDEDAKVEASGVITKTLWKENLPVDVNGAYPASTVEKSTIDNIKINGFTVKLEDCLFYTDKGEVVAKAGDDYSYVTGIIKTEGHLEIKVDANAFPGTYYITGDTYARNENSGDDEFFQFIIPKAKVLSESNTLTLEAEGDPTVFSMSLKVLRPKDGIMMKLVQYEVPAPAPKA